MERPSGTNIRESAGFPPLKRWAIIGCPSGTRRGFPAHDWAWRPRPYIYEYETPGERNMVFNKRLTFTCWNCHRNFSLLIQEESAPQILKECPFCGKECFADLSPYEEDVTDVFRTTADKRQELGKAWNFPAAIPTTAPESESKTQ